jgi:hypothetical protein
VRTRFVPRGAPVRMAHIEWTFQPRSGENWVPTTWMETPSLLASGRVSTFGVDSSPERAGITFRPSEASVVSIQPASFFSERVDPAFLSSAFIADDGCFELRGNLTSPTLLIKVSAYYSCGGGTPLWQRVRRGSTGISIRNERRVPVTAPLFLGDTRDSQIAWSNGLRFEARDASDSSRIFDLQSRIQPEGAQGWILEGFLPEGNYDLEVASWDGRRLPDGWRLHVDARLPRRKIDPRGQAIFIELPGVDLRGRLFPYRVVLSGPEASLGRWTLRREACPDVPPRLSMNELVFLSTVPREAVVAECEGRTPHRFLLVPGVNQLALD